LIFGKWGKGVSLGGDNQNKTQGDGIDDPNSIARTSHCTEIGSDSGYGWLPKPKKSPGEEKIAITRPGADEADANFSGDC
jgi:hypothetical protein